MAELKLRPNAIQDESIEGVKIKNGTITASDLAPAVLQDYITDAASDDQEYVRKNGAWVVNSGGSGGITDIKIDTTSLVTGGVASIPTATSSVKGVVIVDTAVSDTSSNPVASSGVDSAIDAAIDAEVLARDNAIIDAIADEVINRDAVIEAAINALDKAEGTAIADTKTILNYSETDGIVTITTQDIAIMTGATASAAGTKGFVPAPAVGDNEKFLAGDGTWKEVTSETPKQIVDGNYSINAKRAYSGPGSSVNGAWNKFVCWNGPSASYTTYVFDESLNYWTTSLSGNDYLKYRSETNDWIGHGGPVVTEVFTGDLTADRLNGAGGTNYFEKADDAVRINVADITGTLALKTYTHLIKLGNACVIEYESMDSSAYTQEQVYAMLNDSSFKYTNAYYVEDTEGDLNFKHYCIKVLDTSISTSGVNYNIYITSLVLGNSSYPKEFTISAFSSITDRVLSKK